MPPFSTQKLIVGVTALVLLIAISGFFIVNLGAVNGENMTPVIFQVQQGEKGRMVIATLYNNDLIRSTFATEAFALIGGDAFKIQPGLYKIAPSMSTPAILDELSAKDASEATVTIPEGDNIYQIDEILSNALVIPQGALVSYAQGKNLEGKLFPDTYQFFTNANVADVVQKMTDDWNAKAAPLFATDPTNATSDLIIASMVEKEVPDSTDQKIVAGILWKRLGAGIALDVDATVCYVKLAAEYPTSTSCYPLTSADYKNPSPYNTYVHDGLPPGPIGNPGITAIMAAISQESSPYWYYLSDPATGKTIYAKTLDEQDSNRVQYLKSD
jgi:UPF0755 protein